MKYIFLLMNTLIMGSIFGQSAGTDSIYLNPQVPAKFIYGPEELSSFIAHNLIVPYDARYYGINGDVELQYVIGADGNIDTVYVITENIDLGVALEVRGYADVKDFAGFFSIEAIRVIELLSGLFYPALDQGIKVSSAQEITLNFKTRQFEENQHEVRKFKNSKSEKYIHWNFGIYTQTEPDYAMDRYLNGVDKLEINQAEIACKYFEEAVRLKKDFMDAYYNLGIAYRRLSRIDDACSTWQKAKDLGDTEAGLLMQDLCH